MSSGPRIFVGERRRRMMNRRRNQQKGYILIGVLACLSLIMALIAVAMQSALRTRMEVRKHHVVAQTQLLCEAGLQRGLSKWRANSAYVGESWAPSIPEYPGHVAKIEISILDGSSSSPKVQVSAILQKIINGQDSERVQRSERMPIQKKVDLKP